MTYSAGENHPAALGDVLVSTGAWNEDKRAVVVIHVKSTR